MDELQEVERGTRAKHLLLRLDDILHGLKFPRDFKKAPDLIQEVWEARDLLDEYTVRYIMGGNISWDEDILPQAKYCFQLIHNFHENQIKQLS